MKYRQLKDTPRYGNLHGFMLINCHPDWYAAALEYIQATGDTNGFCVMLQGG